MNLPELLEISTKWLAWAGIGLLLTTLIAFIFRWGVRFRLVGATVFTLLLSGSCLVFGASYTPPYVVEGAKYLPVVFDNGYDLIVTQASEDFPTEAIEPTLEQIAGNLKGGGRNGAMVHIRIRKLERVNNGVSKPIILGEIVRDIDKGITLPLKGLSNDA